ncbi:MAG: LptF/LptG family permease [Candidatus Omnitrophota bacterium]
MRILDKYLAIMFIANLIAAICIFFSLYIIIDLFSHLDEILKNGLNLVALRTYYFAFMPKIFVEIAPIASLLSIVYTLSRLNKTNEIIAMRSSGLSIWQINKVVLICGLAISCLIFFINEKVVPNSQYKLLEIKAKEMDKKSARLREQPIKNTAIYGLDNRLFFLSLFDPKNNSLSGIVVLEQDENQNVLSKIVASRGEFKEGRWIFYDCITYKYSKNNELEGEPSYVTAKVMDFKDTPLDIRKQQLQISYMNIKQLKDYRVRLSSSNALKILRGFDIEIQKRLAFPLSTVILMFLSIPISLSLRKKGQIIFSLGVSMGLAFLYYVLNSISIAFGKEGYLPIIISAWLANGLFFVVGWLLSRNLP